MLNIGYDASCRPQMGRQGEVRYVANHRFSEKIIAQGGHQRDTSITAASRAVKKMKQDNEKKSKPLVSLEETFDSNLKSIQNMCDEIEAMKKTMALRMLQWYSALTIQGQVRQYQARWFCKRKRAIRLLSRFIFFKFYFRRRLRAVAKLVNAYRQYRGRRAFVLVMRLHRNAKKIQRWYIRSHKRHILFAKLTVVQMVKRTFDHVMLFGMRRAFRAVLMERDPEYFAVRSHPLVTFFIKCTRRRRLRYLNGPQGKLAFYVLAHYCEGYKSGKANMVLAYIRRRLGKRVRQSDAPPSTSSLSIQPVPADAPTTTTNEPSPGKTSPAPPSQNGGATASSGGRNKGSTAGTSPLRSSLTSPAAVAARGSKKGSLTGSSSINAAISAATAAVAASTSTAPVASSLSPHHTTASSGSFATSPAGTAGTPPPSASIAPFSPNRRNSGRQAAVHNLPGMNGGSFASSPLFSAADLPGVMKGFYRIRSFADAVLLIRDLQRLARLNPSFLDDHTPPSKASLLASAPRRIKPPAQPLETNTTGAAGGNIAASATASGGSKSGASATGRRDASPSKASLGGRLQAGILRAAAATAAATAASGAGPAGTAKEGDAAATVPKPPVSGSPSQAAPRPSRRTNSQRQLAPPSLAKTPSGVDAADAGAVGDASPAGARGKPSRPSNASTASSSSAASLTRQSSIGKSPRVQQLKQQQSGSARSLVSTGSAGGGAAHGPPHVTPTTSSAAAGLSSPTANGARRGSTSSVISALSDDNDYGDTTTTATVPLVTLPSVSSSSSSVSSTAAAAVTRFGGAADAAAKLADARMDELIAQHHRSRANSLRSVGASSDAARSGPPSREASVHLAPPVNEAAVETTSASAATVDPGTHQNVRRRLSSLLTDDVLTQAMRSAATAASASTATTTAVAVPSSSSNGLVAATTMLTTKSLAASTDVSVSSPFPFLPADTLQSTLFRLSPSHSRDSLNFDLSEADVDQLLQGSIPGPSTLQIDLPDDTTIRPLHVAHSERSLNFDLSDADMEQLLGGDVDDVHGTDQQLQTPHSERSLNFDLSDADMEHLLNEGGTDGGIAVGGPTPLRLQPVRSERSLNLDLSDADMEQLLGEDGVDPVNGTTDAEAAAAGTLPLLQAAHSERSLNFDLSDADMEHLLQETSFEHFPVEHDDDFARLAEDSSLSASLFRDPLLPHHDAPVPAAGDAAIAGDAPDDTDEATRELLRTASTVSDLTADP